MTIELGPDVSNDRAAVRVRGLVVERAVLDAREDSGRMADASDRGRREERRKSDEEVVDGEVGRAADLELDVSSAR